MLAVSADPREPCVYLSHPASPHLTSHPLTLSLRVSIQMFSLSSKGQLRREEVCATVQRRSSVVMMTRCSSGGREQLWTLDPVRTVGRGRRRVTWKSVGWTRAALDPRPGETAEDGDGDGQLGVSQCGVDGC